MTDQRDDVALPSASEFEDLLSHGWVWAVIGNDIMLVTRSGGSKVVLASGHSGRSIKPALMVRVSAGRLAPLTDGNHPLAKLLAVVPNMVEVLRDILELDDRPRQLPMIRAALIEGGLL